MSKNKKISEIEIKEVVKKLSNPAVSQANKTKALLPVVSKNPATPQQLSLDLRIEKQIEVDGIGMGVLSDGTPFLTGMGLARLCGIAHQRVSDIGSDWDSTSPKPATKKVKEILQSRGLEVKAPYIKITQRSGLFHAYSDAVCLAVLEYYAFDAGIAVSEQAQKNYRLFASKTLHDFIYAQVGYDPENALPKVWQQFHDRVSLTYNSVPAGFFSIFKEISDMIVTLGQAGLHIDSSFVPDGSVGIH